MGARKEVIASLSAPTSCTCGLKIKISTVYCKGAYNDVVHLILAELRGEINIDLNPVLGVLLFYGMQQ